MAGIIVNADSDFWVSGARLSSNRFQRTINCHREQWMEHLFCNRNRHVREPLVTCLSKFQVVDDVDL